MERHKKWTDGPWTVTKHSWADISIYSSAHRVCGLSISDEATEETQDALEDREAANAHLIAAAPDLVEALEQAVEAWKNEYGSCPPWWEDALAKAYGTNQEEHD